MVINIHYVRYSVSCYLMLIPLNTHPFLQVEMPTSVSFMPTPEESERERERWYEHFGIPQWN